MYPKLIHPILITFHRVDTTKASIIQNTTTKQASRVVPRLDVVTLNAQVNFSALDSNKVSSIGEIGEHKGYLVTETMSFDMIVPKLKVGDKVEIPGVESKQYISKIIPNSPNAQLGKCTLMFILWNDKRPTT